MRGSSRENHYEGNERHCCHGLVAPRWTSWTDENPGRRFYGCPYYPTHKNCGFFTWHDGKFDSRPNSVILELLDDIDHLYDENRILKRVGDQGQRFLDELEAIHVEVKKMKRMQRGKEHECEAWKMKTKKWRGLLVCSWVCFIVIFIAQMCQGH